jgi:hypothetical protein
MCERRDFLDKRFPVYMVNRTPITQIQRMITDFYRPRLWGFKYLTFTSSLYRHLNLNLNPYLETLKRWVTVRVKRPVLLRGLGKVAEPLIQGLGSVFTYLHIDVFTLFKSVVDCRFIP